MKALIALIAFTILSVPASAVETNAKVIDRVQSLALLLSDGRATFSTEFSQVKRTSFKKDNASTNAYVVLFGIEGWNGGNGASQYLAVFKENSKEDWPEEWEFNEVSLISFAKVGEDYWRVFKSISIAGDLITLKGLSWNNDAHCCPSIPTTTVFRFEHDSIVEVVAPKKMLKKDEPLSRPLVPR